MSRFQACGREKHADDVLYRLDRDWACPLCWADDYGEATERLEAAEERVQELEEACNWLVKVMGPCDGAEEDGEDPRCSAPDCTYCEMARVVDRLSPLALTAQQDEEESNHE